MNILQLLAKMHLTVSHAQGRRLVFGNFVKFNGEPVTADQELNPKEGDVVTLGKSTYRVVKNDLQEQ
jgi:tyrosyl-tRNA synthetase